MPTYITQADLEVFFPDLANYGVTTTSVMIGSAETDIVNYFSYIWFPSAYTKFLGTNLAQGINSNGSRLMPVIDLAYLNTAILKNLFIYKTLGYYLFPSLMKTTVEGEDSFFDRGEFYRNKYNDELELLGNAPLYDFNKDGQFSGLDLNKDMVGVPPIRLNRG